MKIIEISSDDIKNKSNEEILTDIKKKMEGDKNLE